MAAPVLKFKRGAFADLPTLAVGEPGFTTDNYQLYVGSPAGNQLIGGGNFWNLEETTTGGGIKLYEGTNNGTDFVELQAPASLSGIQTFIVPATDGSANQVLKTDGSGNLSFADVNVSVIDIDGATDIGAAIADDDLFIVDDGGGGTNRKTAASRLKTYVLGGSSGATFTEVTVGSAVTITESGIDAGTTGIVTAGGGFVGDLTGDVTGNVTGNADTATSATSADTVKTISNDTDAAQFLTFVADNNGSATAEAVRTDAGITYNPSSNLLNVGGNLTVGGTVDGRDVLDDGQAGDNLVTLSGVSRDATNLGSFTGSTIADNETIKGALQDLETELESVSGGGAQAASVAVGQTDANSTHYVTFVSDNNTNPTQESVRTDAGISYNPSSNTLSATNIAGTLTGNVTGDLTGNADTADQVLITPELSSSTSHFVAFAESSVSATDLHRDTGLQYVPSTNTLTATNIAVTGFSLGGTDVTSTATELNILDGVTSFLDEDNMASNSATSIPSQQSVKAYVDSSVSGVAVTFGVGGDSGSGIVTTGTNLTINGTSGEVETVVANNVVTIGLPNTVTITTELNVPTVDVGALRAADGTAAQTIANSTGKVTTSTDHEVQGTFTAAGAAVFQGNTDIGNATSDTLTVTARVDSDFIPDADATRSLGSSALAWKDGHIDYITGTNAKFSGVTTSTEYKGGSLTLTGGGTFGGNVAITGNLSVGGSVTSVNVEDLKVVSPLIEIGLETDAQGENIPPSGVTQYNTGVAMWYNKVGVSSDNAQAAAMFASVKPGGSYRIGFATDVSFPSGVTTEGVASVTAWADIEAKGLWINDCAGQSQVIACSGSTRTLENITVDGGSFS